MDTIQETANEEIEISREYETPLSDFYFEADVDSVMEEWGRRFDLCPLHKALELAVESRLEGESMEESVEEFESFFEEKLTQYVESAGERSMLIEVRNHISEWEKGELEHPFMFKVGMERNSYWVEVEPTSTPPVSNQAVLENESPDALTEASYKDVLSEMSEGSLKRSLNYNETRNWYVCFRPNGELVIGEEAIYGPTYWERFVSFFKNLF